MTIQASLIADSVSPNGIRISTLELDFPRFILPEFNTHRVFSRNAASSRAIPVDRSIQLIMNDTAMPIHWGKNQPGMSAKEECFEPVTLPDGTKVSSRGGWHAARSAAVQFARAYADAGYHKQIVNRLTEPFAHCKVVCTATEFDNFFELRCHPDAQPEIQELARQMRALLEMNIPQPLNADSWHVPYYQGGVWIPYRSTANGEVDAHGNNLRDALAISSSCCAQVSYRRLDDSLDKARDIYRRLIESKPIHASPFEHQATPIGFVDDAEIFAMPLPRGVTHIMPDDTKESWDECLWSGNFRGWIQHRQRLVMEH